MWEGQVGDTIYEKSKTFLPKGSTVKAQKWALLDIPIG
jgi:hypothetical protein